MKSRVMFLQMSACVVTWGTVVPFTAAEAAITIKMVRVVNGVQQPPEDITPSPPPASGTPIQLILPYAPPTTNPEIASEYVSFIHIYTDNPGTNLGPIHLVGNMTRYAPLRVLIASEQTLWPDMSDTALDPCFQHWAGIRATSIEQGNPDNSLQDRIELAAAVRGNIQSASNDTINVGKVFRLQASNTSGTNGWGRIMLPINGRWHNLKRIMRDAVSCRPRH